MAMCHAGLRGDMAKRKARKRSPKRAAAKRAAPSVAAMEAVLAGVAHDIRTPLTGVVALAELLAASDLGPQQREWANAIKSGADHLAALATLIVDAAKAEAAGLTLRHEPFSPRRLAEAIGQSLTARAETRGIKADIAIAGDLPAMVAGDALRLRAALENLADNAVKFTGQGSVAFAAESEPATCNRVRLVFAMSDSGIGLSKRDIARLFRPFVQASAEIARRYGGAGLGLVFVKRIAKAMGGNLTVTSTPGRGSTFRFTALVERAEVAARAEPHAIAAPTRPLALLCAEDNPYGRVVMNTILAELGHCVDFVESGEAALRAVESGGYDAVLMDVMLPGFGGMEATRRIRALPGRAGAVPVIGISGRGEAASEQAARAAGMDFYFTKPVSPSRLAQALSELSARLLGSRDPG
jgi:CheY-like chemotaxis protein/nitrogen-specific signal transduction histidine kinase